MAMPSFRNWGNMTSSDNTLVLSEYSREYYTAMEMSSEVPFIISYPSVIHFANIYRRVHPLVVV